MLTICVALKHEAPAIDGWEPAKVLLCCGRFELDVVAELD